MPKHATPLLDQLESGPWPSFVSDIKQEAAARAANPKGLDYQIPADAPRRPAGRPGTLLRRKGDPLEAYGGIVGVFGYGGGVIGRYCDQPESSPAWPTSTPCVWPSPPPSTTTPNSCATCATSGTCAVPASPTCTVPPVTSCSWAPRPRSWKSIFHLSTHKLHNDLGGSGSNLRTPEACLGQSRCEYACYNTQDMCYQLTQDYQDELHRPAFPTSSSSSSTAAPTAACAPWPVPTSLWWVPGRTTSRSTRTP